ncbi:glycosyltransferase, partial [bacterium]|nr:glycosyltransferase [bacterium]
NNVLFVPTQPLSKYPEILHSSDLGLVTLTKSMVTPTPGKLLSLMAAGLPIVASVPLNGCVPPLIEAHEIGLCSEAGVPDTLVKTILRLYNDKKLREEIGLNARKTAEQVYSRDKAIAKYQKIIGEINV